jgi:ribosomal protein S27AE
MKSIINKLADSTYKRHSFIREWRVFIAITLIAKLTAMTFSIFAGYFFFYDLLFDALNNKTLASVFSIINLIIIEASTAIALTKFFKFTFKGFSWLASIGTLLMAGALFTVSFISSTNGLALRQANIVDQSEGINEAYQVRKDSIVNYYSQRRAEYSKLKEIELNNPQGWKGSKREFLTLKQLENIKAYNNEVKSLYSEEKEALAAIKADYTKELDANKSIMKLEADKYYNIVIIIMILIVIVNGALVYFYSKIVEDDKKEVVNEFKKELSLQADKLIEETFKERLALYFNASGQQQQTRPIQDAQIVQERECKNCGEKFIVEHWNQRYCSPECKIEFFNKG